MRAAGRALLTPMRSFIICTGEHHGARRPAGVSTGACKGLDVSSCRFPCDSQPFVRPRAPRTRARTRHWKATKLEIAPGLIGLSALQLFHLKVTDTEIANPTLPLIQNTIREWFWSALSARSQTRSTPAGNTAHDRVLFGPQHYHRLVAAPAAEAGLTRPLPRGKDGGIQVERHQSLRRRRRQNRLDMRRHADCRSVPPRPTAFASQSRLAYAHAGSTSDQPPTPLGEGNNPGPNPGKDSATA